MKVAVSLNVSLGVAAVLGEELSGSSRKAKQESEALTADPLLMQETICDFRLALVETHKMMANNKNCNYDNDPVLN